jgi:hypothetical protein
MWLFQLRGAPLQGPGTTGRQNSWLQNEGPGPIPGWGVIFLFTLGPSKPLIQRLPMYTSLEAKRPKCEADNSSAPLTFGSGNERTWKVRVKASRFLPHSETFHTVPSASISNKLGRRKNSLITRDKYRKWEKKRRGELQHKEEKGYIYSFCPFCFSVKVKIVDLSSLSHTPSWRCVYVQVTSPFIYNTHIHTHTHSIRTQFLQVKSCSDTQVSIATFSSKIPHCIKI